MTFAVTLLSFVTLAAQSGLGQLRVHVTDPTGAPVQALVEIASEGTRTSRRMTTDPSGAALVRDLPFGLYHVSVRLQGFAPFDGAVEIRSSVPREYPITVELRGVETAVTVRPEGSDTLLDPYGPGSLHYIGLDALQTPPASPPGRELIALVNDQPGWLLEANGTLHPRGSEYQVQYVIDGVPLRENRSPAFSRAMAADAYETVSVRTAGYPAEYGGKLGGVIDVTTRRETREGWHGSAAFAGASFGSVDGHASARYVRGRTGAGFSGEAMRTGRYLDPPTEANRSNSASGTGLSAHLDHRWSRGDRTRVYVERQQTTFLVPNEEFQHAAGQRQERRAEERRAQISHQHLLSNRLLLEAIAMARDTRGTLASNDRSVPIQPSQERELRQGYGKASLSMVLGRHQLKAGFEASAIRLDERFSSTIVSYDVANTPVFDSDLPRQFAFAEVGTQHEQAAFVQDLVRAGRLTTSFGVRYDRTRLRRLEHAWSPRLAASWHVPSASLVLRASYDRVFQTPESENLLLASSNLTDQFGGSARVLPLAASRGDFYEIGVSRLFLGRIRLDGNYFRRQVENFADDDLLLNTAVAFPIAFASGQVQGLELKLDIPLWGPWSASSAYSLSKGTGQLPIAGGLFLGPDVDELLNSDETFPISQDQRHTVRVHVQRRFGPRVSAAAAVRYDSGLPVELEDRAAADLDQLKNQFGARIVDRVDFEAGRVRPAFAIDGSFTLLLWSSGEHALRAHADVANLSNRLNVINFAGLLSGTAVGTPRVWSARLAWTF